MSQEQSAARQLSDVQDFAREAQPIAEDWRQDVGVFAGAHRAEKNDLGVGMDVIGEHSSCPFESFASGVGAFGAPREALQVLDRDPRVR